MLKYKDFYLSIYGCCGTVMIECFVKVMKVTFLAFQLSDVVFTMLINVKMQTIVGILKFICMINFIDFKVFITSRAERNAVAQ